MEEVRSLASRLLAALAAGEPGDPDALEATLARLVASGRARWGIDLPAEAFVDHLATKIEPGAEPAGAIAALHTDDLYLAAACAQGLPAALAAIETHVFGDVEAIVRRARVDAIEPDEVRQVVREKLFLAGKISSFSGKGDLRAWFRVLVTRTVLSLARGGKTRLADDDPEALLQIPAEGSVELDYMRTAYAKELREIFPAALDQLTVADRRLLRQRYLDGLTHDQIATLNQVHRATVKRQLVSARTRLTDALKELLKRRLGVSTEEFESILREVRSQFHITLRRLLVSERS